MRWRLLVMLVCVTSSSSADDAAGPRCEDEIRIVRGHARPSSARCMRVGKLARTNAPPHRLRVLGRVHDRTISDPIVGGEASIVHDWSIIGACPDAFVEVEAEISEWETLEEAMSQADGPTHPLHRWGLVNARVVAVLGSDWLTADRTCERDVPPWP
jgi:hypothetical protein